MVVARSLVSVSILRPFFSYIYMGFPIIIIRQDGRETVLSLMGIPFLVRQQLDTETPHARCQDNVQTIYFISTLAPRISRKSRYNTVHFLDTKYSQ